MQPQCRATCNSADAVKDNQTAKNYYRVMEEDQEILARLNEICRNNGFDYARYLGEYKGEKIYKPSFDLGDDVLFGRPCYLHVKGKKIRRSKNWSEVSKIMHYFFPSDEVDDDEEDDEDDNED